MSAPAHRPLTDPELLARLQRWVAEGIIGPDEAAAIEAFEAERRPEAVTAERVPLLTESLAYGGGALAVAAGVVLLRDAWADLVSGVRAAIVGAAGLAALAAGFVLRRSEEPAYARLASLSWFVATGLTAWFAGLLAGDVLRLQPRAAALAASGAASAVGAVLFAVRRRSLQQLALLMGLLGLAASIVYDAPAAPTAVWGVGIAWILLGSLGWIRPTRTAMAAGAIVSLWIPRFVQTSGGRYAMWLGLATALLALTLGVARREAAMLGLGGLGLLGYLVWVLSDLFARSLAMPVVLLLAGALMLVLALRIARRSGRRLRPGSPRTPS